MRATRELNTPAAGSVVRRLASTSVKPRSVAGPSCSSVPVQSVASQFQLTGRTVTFWLAPTTFSSSDSYLVMLGDRMWTCPVQSEELLTNSTEVRLVSLRQRVGMVEVELQSYQARSVCPSWGAASGSRCMRKLIDLPWQGLPVRILLRMRRFFCLRPLHRSVYTRARSMISCPQSRRSYTRIQICVKTVHQPDPEAHSSRWSISNNPCKGV